MSLGCFVSLRTSSFRTNWCHLMPSSIRRHHWSSALILRASVLDIAQQSEPYRNIGKMHVLYSFNFVEMEKECMKKTANSFCGPFSTTTWVGWHHNNQLFWIFMLPSGGTAHPPCQSYPKSTGPLAGMRADNITGTAH